MNYRPVLAKSNKVITLLMAKSQTRNKHDKDTPKGAHVYSKQGLALMVLSSGGDLVGSGQAKIATRAPPCLCNAAQTYHPPDPTYEHTASAARVGVARDLYISPWQAK
jgi:hypothetical protein